MKKALALVFGTLLLASCSSGKYPDFREISQGLYLKILAFDNDQKATDSCAVYEVYVHSTDSTLSALLNPQTKDNLPQWLKPGDSTLHRLKRYLQHIQPGDSILFIDEKLESKRDSIRFALWWKSCYTVTEFEEVYAEWLEDREVREAHRIRLFALDNGFTSSIVHPRVLYRLDETGNGEPLSYGDEIAIEYSGYFLNGEPFDDAGNSMTFELGTEGQILKGLEYGLIGVRPGETRSVVIPSIFAFGERGSAVGIVPPFTPVWYKVKVLPLPADSAS